MSDAGLLAYRTGRNLIRGQYVWFDRAGAEIARVGAPERDRQSNPNLSPDGSRVALQRSVAGNLADLWLLELNQGTFTPITSDPTIEAFPVWSPEGRRLAFNSTRGSTPGTAAGS